MNLMLDSIIVKRVGESRYSNRPSMGKIYLPHDFIGKKVSIRLVREEEEDTKTE